MEDAYDFFDVPYKKKYTKKEKQELIEQLKKDHPQLYAQIQKAKNLVNWLRFAIDELQGTAEDAERELESACDSIERLDELKTRI